MVIAVAMLCSCCFGSRPALELAREAPEAEDGGFEVADAAAGPTIQGKDSAGVDANQDAAMDQETAEGQLTAPLIEARGVWVTRWDYQVEQDVRNIIHAAASAGLNQVYFQVRGEADAYYRSTIEPWAAPLSGRLGRDPGWDPLAVAIEEAHKRGLELHAWINVATAWKGRIPPGVSRPRHILRSHPDWRLADQKGRPMSYSDDYVFVNPAHPDLQSHLEAVVGEIASFYAIDGLHLDYARYPFSGASFDRTSNRLYRKAKGENPDLTRADWQRQQLALLVGRLRDRAREVRPGIVVSAAVTGIYQDRWGWSDVIRGLDDFHQDSHLWARMKVVDILIPMIYWPPTDPPGGRTDFRTLVEDFAPLKELVQLLVGINLETGSIATHREQLYIARERGYSGVVLFSWGALKKRGWIERLKQELFAERAVPR